MNEAIRAALAVYKKTKQPFTVKDLVDVLTYIRGSSSANRPNVLTTLRLEVRTGLQSIPVVSAGGNYGWLYSYADEVVLPPGFQEVRQETPRVARTRAARKTSEEWMAVKGLQLPTTGAPTGWDLQNFYQSFSVDKITEAEFSERWNVSYDPDYGVKVPETWYRSFATLLQSRTGLNVGLETPVRLLCMDQPDLDNLLYYAQNMSPKVLKTKQGVDSGALLDKLKACSTVGEMVAVIYSNHETTG